MLRRLCSEQQQQIILKNAAFSLISMKKKKISHPAKMWSLAQLLLLNNKPASSKNS